MIQKKYFLTIILATSCFSAIRCSTSVNVNNPAKTSGVTSGGPCIDLPSHDANLMFSTANRVSHYKGRDCMGCHNNATGTAQTKWIVAGTIVNVQGSTTAAAREVRYMCILIIPVPQPL